MKRMIIQGVRWLLFGGQPAQQPMRPGSNNRLTGVERSLEPAQSIFPSGTDGRSSGKKRLFFWQKTAILSAKNARSLVRKFLFPREEIFVPSGGNHFSFPHLALRSLLLIVLILGGVLESGAATTVTSASELQKALGNNASVSGNTVTLKSDIKRNAFTGLNIEVSGGSIVLDLNGYRITNYNYALFVIKSGAGIIIKNGRMTTSVKPVIRVEGGTLKLQDVELYNALPITLKYEASGSILDCLSQGYGYFLNDKLQTNPENELGNSLTLSISKISYTLKYSTNGGTPVSDQSYNIGSPLSSLAVAPSRPGYKFEGWYFDATFTKAAIDVKDAAFYPNNSETVSLYAKWTPASYTIQFNSQGGSPIADESYTIETSVTLKV